MIYDPPYEYLLPLWFRLLKYLKKSKGKRIAVLGFKGAGKTRLYRILQNRPYVEEKDKNQTLEEPYAGFDYTKSDGTVVKIKEGADYGGAEELAQAMYEPLISENDTIFFVLDLFEMTQSAEVNRITKVRLHYVAKECTNKGKELYIFGSHIDCFENQDAVKEHYKEIQSYMLENETLKKYSKSFFPVDLTHTEQTKEIIDRIF